MTESYFRTGGPFDAREVGPEQMEWPVPVCTDEQGRIARCCPDETCSPGYYAVTFRPGLEKDQTLAYCPYCRHATAPSHFFSTEKLRHMSEVVRHEAAHALQNMLSEAFRNASGPVSFKPSQIPLPRQPFEDDVQRNVVCPRCGLDHAVFGLAIWCPDCGQDIFVTHVEAEYGVVRAMLNDVDRRREELGPRIGARDLENCLEDTVSIFEAVLKAMLIRHLRAEGTSGQEIEGLFKNRFKNRLQNPERAAEIIRNRMNQELFEGMSENEVQSLRNTFEKRHPITHNLGVIDKKYLERAMAADMEGKDILVTKAEIEQAIEASLSVLRSLHQRVFVIPSRDGAEEEANNKESDRGQR